MPDTCEERYQLTHWIRVVLIGLSVGFLTGLFGVGGGFLIVPALVTLVGLPMRLAVGTSLIAISLNALWRLIGNLPSGALDWTLTLLFAAGGAAGVLAGASLARRLPESVLRSLFAVLILGIALYTFARSTLTLLPFLGTY